MKNMAAKIELTKFKICNNYLREYQFVISVNGMEICLVAAINLNLAIIQ